MATSTAAHKIGNSSSVFSTRHFLQCKESAGFCVTITAMDPLEERVAKIEERNASVELDKAWETSGTRRVLIIAFTYAVIGLFLQTIHIDRPWLAAIVPAIAFTLSTLTMPYFKERWIERQEKQ
jgi:hypothetical protein